MMQEGTERNRAQRRNQERQTPMAWSDEPGRVGIQVGEVFYTSRTLTLTDAKRLYADLADAIGKAMEG